MKNYDLITIGTGAGSIVIETALFKGHKCAVIEKGNFGGTCLNRGCTPTKVLATVADETFIFKNAGKLGINAENISVDWNKVSKNVWDKINFNKTFRENFRNMKNLDVFEGEASFINDKTIKVTYKDGITENITADKIVINTGGITNVPNIEGLDDVGYVTGETFFGEKFPKKPYKSLIIVGGGPIGCEFAHIFDALGGNISIVQHNVRLLPKEDEEISQSILDHFTSRNINVILNQDTLSIKKEGNEKVLKIKDRTTGEVNFVRGDEILIAPGILPATKNLGLENTNIKTDKRGYVRTNEFLETSVEDVYAIGDINGKAQFRHKANYEAETLSHNLYLAENKPEDLRWARYDLVPAVTFTYPQVAHIGLSEAEATRQGYDVKVGKHMYSQTVKGYSLGFRNGDPLDCFAKAVVDKETNEILGIHVIGPEAANLIQPYVNLMSAGNNMHAVTDEDICSAETALYRQSEMSRYLDPHNINTVLESMTPHPALTELVTWLGWFLQ